MAMAHTGKLDLLYVPVKPENGSRLCVWNADHHTGGSAVARNAQVLVAPAATSIPVSVHSKAPPSCTISITSPRPVSGCPAMGARQPHLSGICALSREHNLAGTVVEAELQHMPPPLQSTQACVDTPRHTKE